MYDHLECLKLFEAYIPLKSNIEALKLVNEKIKEILITYELRSDFQRVKPLLISSVSPGMGKTHLLSILYRKLQKRSIFFCYTTDVVERFSFQYCEDLINNYDILIVEDVYDTNTIKSKKFTKLINEFYQTGKPLFITACEQNVPRQQLCDHFSFLTENIATLKELDFDDRKAIYLSFKNRLDIDVFTDEEVLLFAKASNQNIRNIKALFRREQGKQKKNLINSANVQ